MRYQDRSPAVEARSSVDTRHCTNNAFVSVDAAAAAAAAAASSWDCQFLSRWQLLQLCIPTPLRDNVPMLGPLFRRPETNQQGHGVSTHCTAAEVMGLLGRKLGGGGTALIASAEAIPLLNEAWQVCVHQGARFGREASSMPPPGFSWRCQRRPCAATVRDAGGKTRTSCLRRRVDGRYSWLGSCIRRSQGWSVSRPP